MILLDAVEMSLEKMSSDEMSSEKKIKILALKEVRIFFILLSLFALFLFFSNLFLFKHTDNKRGE
jgi:hypothetical protein